jgi:microcystin degradation protein MlrC
VPIIGAHAVVVADADEELAAKHAERLGREMFSLRHQIASTPSTLDDCLRRALEVAQGPVTIADTGDNPGGGAPCDSTHFLRALLDRGIENAAIGPLWDPIAVSVCQDAGVGSTLRLRVGGKLGETSGDPVDVTATVIGLCDNVRQETGGAPTPLGPCAGIKVLAAASGIDVTLSTRRTQGRAPNLFSDVGIDPGSKHILVVKSSQHFHAGFAPISSQVLYAGDTGALPGDVRQIPYERVATARYWPFSEDPFAG